MYCQFLCEKHKTRLNESLAATGPIWASWIRQGEAAQAAGEDQQSLQFFGCAYDLAVLQVNRFTAHGELDGQPAVERLMIAGARLTEALARSGYLALRRDYLKQIQSLLYREQVRTPLLAQRLPLPDWDFDLSLDAYSGRCRAGGAPGLNRRVVN